MMRSISSARTMHTLRLELKESTHLYKYGIVFENNYQACCIHDSNGNKMHKLKSNRSIETTT